MQKNIEGSKDREYYLFALRLISDFGVSIAVPVVAFVLIGQWLDRSYGFGHKATIAAFILAALISGKIVYRKAKEYGKQYQALLDKKNK